MNDLISKSELRTEIIKLHTKKGYIKRSEVLQLLNNIPCEDNVLVLPCAVGTTVWTVFNNQDACSECIDFERGVYHNWCSNENVIRKHGDPCVYDPQSAVSPLCKKHFYEVQSLKLDTLAEIFVYRNCFGKTMFLTRDEADAKLEELNKEMEHE